MLKYDLSVGGVYSITDRIQLAERAEESGLSGIWHGEPASEEAFVPLTAIAMRTSTVDVGSSIVGWTRSLPVMESTASNVQKIAGGRFRLGIGTFPRQRSEGWYGIPHTQGRARMAEYVRGLRVLWSAGIEPVSFEGEFYQVRDYIRRDGPLEVPIPIFLAATGPKTARLAGQVADGVTFNSMLPAEYLRDVMIPELVAGAAESGRATPTIVATTRVAIARDRREAVDRVKPSIVSHICVADYYQTILAHYGLQSAFFEIRDVTNRDGAEAAAALPVMDELVKIISLAGTRDDVVPAAKQYEGIVDRLSLQAPVAGLGREEALSTFENVIDAFATSSRG